MGMLCFEYTMNVCHVWIHHGYVMFGYTMGMSCLDSPWVCHVLDTPCVFNVLDTPWGCPVSDTPCVFHVLDTPWVYNVWIHHGYVDLMKHVRHWVRFFKLVNARIMNHEFLTFSL